MDILQYPKDEAKLRTVSEPVTDFAEAGKICDKLEKILSKHDNCMALAAIQTDIPKRIFVMKTKKGIVRAINPEIVKQKNKMPTSEGCMSFDMGKKFISKVRYQGVRLCWDTGLGELEWESKFFNEIEAVCVQHEVDHLDGKLMIDK